MCRSTTTASDAQFVGELERLETVVGQGDDGQLGLLLDQDAKSRGVPLVVVREQDADRSEVSSRGSLSIVRLPYVETRQTLPPIAVIGAALDLGAGRRGVDMGPSAIRYAGAGGPDP